MADSSSDESSSDDSSSDESIDVNPRIYPSSSDDERIDVSHRSGESNDMYWVSHRHVEAYRKVEAQLPKLPPTLRTQANQVLEEYKNVFVDKTHTADEQRQKCIEDANMLLRCFMRPAPEGTTFDMLLNVDWFWDRICKLVNVLKEYDNTNIIDYIPQGGESLLQECFKIAFGAASSTRPWKNIDDVNIASPTISADTLPVLANPNYTFGVNFKIWELVAGYPKCFYQTLLAMVNAGIFDWLRPIYGTVNECFLHVCRHQYPTEWVLDIMKALVLQGADVNADSGLPLISACRRELYRCGDDYDYPALPEFVTLMIQHGAKVYSPGRRRNAYLIVCDAAESEESEEEPELKDMLMKVKSILKKAAIEEGWKAIVTDRLDADFIYYGRPWLTTPHFAFVVKQLQEWCEEEITDNEYPFDTDTDLKPFVMHKFQLMRIEQAKDTPLVTHTSTGIPDVPGLLQHIMRTHLGVDRQLVAKDEHARFDPTNWKQVTHGGVQCGITHDGKVYVCEDTHGIESGELIGTYDRLRKRVVRSSKKAKLTLRAPPKPNTLRF
jgi:hypothetical protein